MDDADHLNPDSTQPAFRGVIEEFGGNCAFIFTCNYKNKIIPALHSRMPPIDFVVAPEVKDKLVFLGFKRMSEILKLENVECDQKVLVALVKKHFPDFRRLLGELQKFSLRGSIDASVLSQGSEAKIDEAIDYLKQKDFRSMRKWIALNADNDASKIMHQLLDRMGDIVKPEYVPSGIVILNKYHRDLAFSPDQEITLAGFVCEFMIEMEMKI
jgi:DNA polymerase III delta prime subunit